jgi:hypothetical protein
VYNVDRKDTVFELSSPPRPDVGAPLPIVFATDYAVALAYIVSEPDPHWDGKYVEVVSPNTDGKIIALVTFRMPRAHMMGPPNDEAFNGHPLYGRGLKPYTVSEVQQSSWIRSLGRMNSVHPMHRAEHFKSYRHFIFAFHDSTFECVAEGFTLECFRGSLRNAVDRLAVVLDD